MMNQKTPFFSRCLAFALALVLLLSEGVIPSAFAVTVEGDELNTTAGAIVAENYDLTDAEAALLSSGLLADKSYTYAVPGDGDNLISVDTARGVITAADYQGWVPVRAQIMIGEEVKQTVTFTGGEASYNTSVGKAFSVRAEYALKVTLDTDFQQTMLDTSGWLKQGVLNTDTVSDQSGNLYILEKAMPELVNFAENGIKVGSATVGFSDELKAVVKDLNNQMTRNGGKLDLTVMVEEYNNSTKTGYVLTKGTEMQAEVIDFAAGVTKIHAALSTMANNLSALISSGIVSQELGNQLKTLAGVAENLKNALTPVAEDPWTAAGKGTVLVKDGITDAEYTKLDSLVAALGDISVPTVKETLTAAVVTIQANLSMCDVQVDVVLQVVENKADSAALVVWDTQTVKLTLPEGADADAIRTAIEKNGVEAAAKELWAGFYAEGAFESGITGLPETLTQDSRVTITYTPKNYTVTYGVGFDGKAADTVPYGYKLTLTPHKNAEKAYDYTVNGDYYAQSTVYTVVGDTAVSRQVGKAYTETDLFSVIADNYANAVGQAILKSGALMGNEQIRVRMPDNSDVETLLSLKEGTITAKQYEASYEGLSWDPYTYGAAGSMTAFGAGFTGSWSANSVDVNYILKLSNFGTDRVAQILTTAAVLKEEAEKQTETLDRLAEYYSTMQQLDKTKLGALSGVVDVTDFSDDPEKNEELRAYFKGVIKNIISNSLAPDGYLKIYHILGEYLDENNGGLRYYYANSDLVLAEIETLSGYLSDLLADEEKKDALYILVASAGEQYVSYGEKIEKLEGAMAEVKASLTAPNDAIDLTSENLGKLVDALEAQGTVVTQTAATPYLISGSLTAMDGSRVMVHVTVAVSGNTLGVAQTAAYDRNTVLTAEIAAQLRKEIDAIVAENLGENQRYYTLNVTGGDLDALIGTALTERVYLTYNYVPKEYAVLIGDQQIDSVNINDLEITLPAHEEKNYVYRYTIDGKVYEAGRYVFTAEQLDRLFTSGSYTIVREEVNLAAEKLESMVLALNQAVGASASEPAFVLVGQGNDYTGITANIGSGDLMMFAMGLVDSGFGYVGLHGQGLMYLNEDSSLEISIQSLIDAMMYDNSFGSERLISLGRQGRGRLLTTTMQLGNSAEDLYYEDLEFIVNLTSISPELKTVSDGLMQISPYMTFQANDGTMNVALNMPEGMYETYLTTLLATGNLDKRDMNAVNQRIAFQFLHDYIDLILHTEANTTTFNNTLAILGQDTDLTGYEAFYQLVKDYMTREGTTITYDHDYMEVDVAFDGKLFIDDLMEDAALDPADYSTELGMVKEYKAGGTISGTSVAVMENVNTDYDAVILDLKGTGAENKFEYTDDLPADAGAITGDAVIILLDDVRGDLSLGRKDTLTVLDLNGKNVAGSITAGGTLIIVDSSLNTAASGKVSGKLSGDITVLGGSYAEDVTAFLQEGYVQSSGTVSNVLYTVRSDAQGNVTFVLNTGVLDQQSLSGYLPSAHALAMDMALELVMGQVTSAALALDGSTAYTSDQAHLIQITNNCDTLDALMPQLLSCVDTDGLSGMVDALTAGLLDFAAVERAAADPDAVIAAHTLEATPWKVTVAHVKNDTEDYLAIAVDGSADYVKSYTVSLVLDGRDNGAVAELAGQLKYIADGTTVTTAITGLSYDSTANALKLTASLALDLEADLTGDKQYATVTAVLLANGSAQKAAALAAAVNDGDREAMKAVVDEMTVADLFAALKAMDPNVSFAAMAKNAGVTVDVSAAAALEEPFHRYLCALGAELKAQNISGTAETLGSLGLDGEGLYGITKSQITGTISPDGGFGADYALRVSTLNLNLRLFKNEGAVEVKDAAGKTLVRTDSFDEAWDVLCAQNGASLTIHEAFTLEKAAYTLNHSIAVINAANLTMDDAWFFLSAQDQQIRTDSGELKVASAVNGYRAARTGDTYSLTAIAVEVSRPAAAEGWAEDGYLFLDLHPMDGLSLDGLTEALTLTGLDYDSLILTVAGSTGDGLIKTADTLKIEAVSGSHVVAAITCTAIVLGDTNCNGKIQAADAVVVMNLYNGVTYSTHHTARTLAADTTKNGKIQAGDAIRIMTKWFLAAEAKDAGAAWDQWCEMVDASNK